MAVYSIKGSAFYGGSQTFLVNVPTGADLDESVAEWIQKKDAALKRRHGTLAPKFRLHSIGEIVPELEGVDQWGKFYDLTGHEAKGLCFWCGSENRGRYCCNSHKLQYLRNFNWTMARDWCWGRYASQCGMCSKPRKEWYAEQRLLFSSRNYEVHHIEPLEGSFRGWTKLDKPDNLILLCPDCHDLTKRKDFAGLRTKSDEQLTLM